MDFVELVWFSKIDDSISAELYLFKVIHRRIYVHFYATLELSYYKKYDKSDSSFPPFLERDMNHFVLI